MKTKEFYEDDFYIFYISKIKEDTLGVSFHYYSEGISKRGYYCVYYDLVDKTIKDITFEDRSSILENYNEFQLQKIIEVFEKEINEKINQYEIKINQLRNFKKTEKSVKIMQEKIEELKFVLLRLR